MQLADYVAAVRRRWLTIAISTIAFIALACTLAITQRPSYEAESRVFLSANGGANIADINTGTTLAQELVTSYAQVAVSPYVLSKVITSQDLPQNETTLAKQVTASAISGSSVISIIVEDNSASRAAAIATSVATTMQQEVGNLTVADNSADQPVKMTVIQPASVPSAPSKPNVLLIIAIGVITGVVVGVSLAILTEVADTRIRTIKALEGFSDLPLLGSIDVDNSYARRPLNTDPAVDFHRTEAFRYLLANLQFMDLPSAPVIAVTSALPAEGKSSIVANLAIALAEGNQRVLVVDADMRRPRLADLFGVEASIGLSDVLAGNATHQDAIQPWGQRRLSILPAGKIPPNPAELIRGPRVVKMLEDLRGSFDIIIFDTPPVMAAPDSVLLAAGVDGILLAVSMHAIRRPQLKATLDQLSLARARMLGYVANRTPRQASAYYGYGN